MPGRDCPTFSEIPEMAGRGSASSPRRAGAVSRRPLPGEPAAANEVAESRGLRAALAALLLLGVGVSGCKKHADIGAGSAPSARPASPAVIASGLPIAREIITQAVNPGGDPTYTGPAGAVKGIITVTGDTAPEQTEILSKIPSDCAPAREVYGRLFREGPGRALGDVLVAVTGYKGYVPTQRSVQVVEGNGCAWSTRTVAMTFGERLDIVAKDRRAYVPDLMGARMAAQIIALPGGSGSSLYAQKPGRYVLVDSMRIFATAEVLVLKYATHDVTGLDGRYEIGGIPVGKVTLSALLPATGVTVERTVQIEPGRTQEINLEISFDREKHAVAPGATSASPVASGSPPAGPPSARATTP